MKILIFFKSLFFKEFDHPYILLQKQNGYLRSMVDETGSAMADVLMKMAENTYKSVNRK